LAMPKYSWQIRGALIFFLRGRLGLSGLCASSSELPPIPLAGTLVVSTVEPGALLFHCPQRPSCQETRREALKRSLYKREDSISSESKGGERWLVEPLSTSFSGGRGSRACQTRTQPSLQACTSRILILLMLFCSVEPKSQGHLGTVERSEILRLVGNE